MIKIETVLGILKEDHNFRYCQNIFNTPTAAWLLDSISYDSRALTLFLSRVRLKKEFLEKPSQLACALYQRDRLSSGHSGPLGQRRLSRPWVSSYIFTVILEKAQTAGLYWHQGARQSHSLFLPIRFFPKIIVLPCSRLWTLLWWRDFLSHQSPDYTESLDLIRPMACQRPDSFIMEVSSQAYSRSGFTADLMSVSSYQPRPYRGPIEYPTFSFDNKRPLMDNSRDAVIVNSGMDHFQIEKSKSLLWSMISGGAGSSNTIQIFRLSALKLPGLLAAIIHLIAVVSIRKMQ